MENVWILKRFNTKYSDKGNSLLYAVFQKYKYVYSYIVHFSYIKFTLKSRTIRVTCKCIYWLFDISTENGFRYVCT